MHKRCLNFNATSEPSTNSNHVSIFSQQIFKCPVDPQVQYLIKRMASMKPIVPLPTMRNHRTKFLGHLFNDNPVSTRTSCRTTSASMPSNTVAEEGVFVQPSGAVAHVKPFAIAIIFRKAGVASTAGGSKGSFDISVTEDAGGPVVVWRAGTARASCC